MNMILLIVGGYLEYHGYYVSGTIVLFVTFTHNFETPKAEKEGAKCS